MAYRQDGRTLKRPQRALSGMTVVGGPHHILCPLKISTSLPMRPWQLGKVVRHLSFTAMSFKISFVLPAYCHSPRMKVSCLHNPYRMHFIFKVQYKARTTRPTGRPSRGPGLDEQWTPLPNGHMQQLREHDLARQKIVQGFQGLNPWNSSFLGRQALFSLTRRQAGVAAVFLLQARFPLTCKPRNLLPCGRPPPCPPKLRRPAARVLLPE